MRGLDALRAALGAALIVRPEPVLRRLGEESSRPLILAARVLAGRLLLQAGVGALASTRPASTLRRVHVGDACVETAHAATMVLLARRRPAHRRLALTSAACALVLAGADVAAVERSRRDRPRTPGA